MCSRLQGFLVKGQKANLSSTAEVSDNLCSVSKSASMRSNKLVTSEQKMQSLIATALRTDLNMSVQISMKAVSNKFNCWHLLTI
jgi:hypothetical protein